MRDPVIHSIYLPAAHLMYRTGMSGGNLIWAYQASHIPSRTRHIHYATLGEQGCKTRLLVGVFVISTLLNELKGNVSRLPFAASFAKLHSSPGASHASKALLPY